MAFRRKTTIDEVREARPLVQRLDASGDAPEGVVLTDRMHAAVLRLQERMADLDHQWQRSIMLDVHGIFVYNERGGNWWKPNVRLSRDAKIWNDGQVRNYVVERRLLLETLQRPGLGIAPPPRVEAAASATSSHPNDYPDNRTPTPPRSRARPHPPAPTWRQEPEARLQPERPKTPEPEEEPPEPEPPEEQQAPGSWNGASRERALTKARPPEEPRQHTPRDRRSLNNIHQPGQAGSAIPPPNIQQAHEVNPGSEMDGPSPPVTGPKSRHSENIGT